MLRSQFAKYDPIFNFFFSKPVNDLCQDISSPQEMILKELGYWDNEHEFLKRYYRVDEVPERIQLLVQIHHPERMWTNQVATLMSGKDRRFVQKRIKRQKKLQRKLQEIREEEAVEFDSSFMSSEEDQDGQQGEGQVAEGTKISYDSEVHNIYEDFQDIPLKEMVMGMGGTGLVREEDGGWGEVDGPQHLMLDFDDIDRNNILKDYNRMKAKDLKQQQKAVRSSSLTRPSQLPLLSQLKPHQLIHKKFVDTLKQQRPRSKLTKVISHQNIPLRYQRQQSQSPYKPPLWRQQEVYNEIQEKRNLLKLKQMTARDQNDDTVGYLSPRLKELNKYSKRIILNKKPSQRSLEHGDYGYEDAPLERVWSPGATTNTRHHYKPPSPERIHAFGLVNSLHQKASATLQQQRYRTVIQQPSESESNTLPQSRIRPPPVSQQWIDPTRQRRDFDRIRKKAMQLIRQQRNYPSPNDMHRYRRYK